MASLDSTAATTPGSREANENLRSWLYHQGDGGLTSRTVLHYAYPSDLADPQSRDLIAREMRGRGFAVSDAISRNGLVFRHRAVVASDRFDAITADIAELLSSVGWEYDAWECEPRKDPALVYWRTLEGLSLR